MAYRVKIESFEGPFDLLLYLVSRQKLDVGDISITQIADQYLFEVQRMGGMDLDVASDFLLTAATLLKIKADSMLQLQTPVDEDVAEMLPSEARELLIEKLLNYKTYKSASMALENRFHAEGLMFTRTVGAHREFENVMPDFLYNIALDDIVKRAAEVFSKQEIDLLGSKHIAAKPLPLLPYMEHICDKVKEKGSISFSDLISNDCNPSVFVVNFLAILELNKRGAVRLRQKHCFGDIQIDYAS